MFLTYSEGKSVIAEKFIITLKNKTYKYITSKSKNVHIDKSDNTVNKYNNIYHRKIKMKPSDIKSNKHINSSKEINDKDPVISDLISKEIVGKFFEKELQKTNQKEFRFEKVIKRKGKKLYVKCEGYDSSFNSWIDKKDMRV